MLDPVDMPHDQDHREYCHYEQPETNPRVQTQMPTQAVRICFFITLLVAISLDVIVVSLFGVGSSRVKERAPTVHIVCGRAHPLISAAAAGRKCHGNTHRRERTALRGT